MNKTTIEKILFLSLFAFSLLISFNEVKAAASPDLTISDIYCSGSYIYVKYCNNGSSLAGGFGIRIKNMSTGQQFPGSQSGTQFPIPASGSCATTGGITSSLIGVSCSQLSSVMATADWEGRVSESNESNNSFTKTIGTAAVNGTCGTAHGKTISYAATSYSPYTQCSTGTPSSTALPEPGHIKSWICNGSNGGTSSKACTAFRAEAPIVNGVCGSSNGQSFTSKPSTNLCSAGTSSSVSGSGPWTWSCTGSNGGTTASCSANKTATPVNGVCGTAARTFPYNATSYTGYSQCTTGTSSNTNFPAQGSSTSWICQGSNGGSNSGTCTASRSAAPISGVCGSSNGGTFTSKPSTNLCSAGTSSSVSGSGPWTWSCTGSNGGTTASCSASKASLPDLTISDIYCSGSYIYIKYCNNGLGTNGQAFGIKLKNMSTGKEYQGLRVSVPSVGACTTTGGITSSLIGVSCSQLTSVMATADWKAEISESNENNNTLTKTIGTSVINGVCGSSNGQSFTSKPSTNLCSAGTSSSVSGSGPWTWSCTGSNGGTTASCSANKTATPVNGVCGTAARTFPYNATSYTGYSQCTTGTSSNVNFPAQGTSTTWICQGSNGGSNSGTCTASRASAVVAVNGTCGTSNGGTFATIPTTNLCSNGSASIVSGTGPWTWSCTGSNGGTNASCSANKTATPVNGVCGTAARTFPYNATSYSGYSQCTTGTSSNTSFPAQGGTVSWVCQGSNGGSNSGTCTASRSAAPISGVCGSSNGGTFATIPTTNLCSAGTSSVVTGTGPWTWACTGSNGGSNITCSANKTAAPVAGTCGTAAKTYLSNDVAFSGTFCGVGTASPSSPAFPAQGSSTSWVCQGLNGGTTVSCSAPRGLEGTCGTSNGGTFTSAPEDNLCLSGTATDTNGSGPWYWTCQGVNGGATASCSANRTPDPINGVCGSSDGERFTSIPVANLCSFGTASAVSGSGPWTWTCAGLNGGTTDSCNALKVTNGSCGTSNGGTFTSAPTTDLCASGTPTSSAWNGYNWAWVCQSCDGGATDFCYGYRPAGEVCGSSNGGSFDSAPISNLCDIGIPSAVSGSGPWTWTCNNAQGEVVGSCSANQSAPPLQFMTYSRSGSNNSCECENNQSTIKSSVSEYFSSISRLSQSMNPIVKTIGAREINEGESIVLRSVVKDSTNTKLTYSWACTGGTISNVNELSPTYTAHIGDNILRNNTCILTVKNEQGGISVKAINIRIR